MLFITFEGIDGSGKTTIAKFLKERLISKSYDVILTREPGGNKISEEIRNIILNKNNIKIDPWTEALLYIAARKQHFSLDILPYLKNGKIVICDRFIDSTLVYQGYARGLGIRVLDEIQKNILGTIKPDLTLFFDIDPSEAIKRINLRINEKNRIDLEKKKFHEKVYEGYQFLISENSDRIKIINARKSINEVLEQVYYYVDEILFNIKNNL